MANSPTTAGPWFATNVKYPDDGTMAPDDEQATWTVSTDPDRAGWRHDGGYPGYGVSEANARLMAAAPDLLYSLKECVELLQFLTSRESELERAVAAIAKAEGVINDA